MSVSAEERHTKAHPCPVCGGHQGMPSGKGVRCAGYSSLDGKWCFCSRVDEGAHHVVESASPQLWAHLLKDDSQINGEAGGFTLHAAPTSPVAASRRIVAIERAIHAIDVRSEAARSQEEYEADRREYDALWDELEALHRVKTAAQAPVEEVEPEPVQWLGLAEMAKPLPPVQWRCEPLKIAEGPCSCLAGYGYSGKTAIGQNLLLCMATGKDLFGIYKCTQMPVGWMDYEQGRRLSFGRLQRQARGLGIDLSQYPTNALRYAEFPDVYLTEKGDGVDKIARAVDGMGLCMLDSAKAITPGMDENDSKIRIPFDALSRVTAKTGCVFLVVHHFGKTGEKPKALKERMRGSSALFDAMQTVWGLEQNAREGYTQMSLSKDRVTNVSELVFGVRFEDDEVNDAVILTHLDTEQMKPRRAYDELKERIVSTVKLEPGLSGNGIFARVGGSRPTVLEAIRELSATGTKPPVLAKDNQGGYRAV